MKISEHVYFYPAEQEGHFHGSNTSVIKGKKQIIIDPDTDKNNHLLKLRLLMKEDGIALEDTDEIWITHAHPDHIAMVGKLVKDLNCRVSCHPLSIGIFESPSPMEYFCTQMIREANKINLKILNEIAQSFPRFPEKMKIFKKISIPRTVSVIRIIGPLLYLILGLPSLAAVVLKRALKRSYGNLFSSKIHKTFRDGEIIKNGGIDIKIIFFPGHTPDEVAFYVIQEKILITGDLIKVPKDKKNSGQTPFIPVFNSPYSSFEEALSSLKKIRDLDVETLMPGHRQQITGEKLIKSCLVQMEEEMVKKKRLVANLKNRGMADAEILKYVIRDISKSYPNCSQTDQMFYAYLLLKSSV